MDKKTLIQYTDLIKEKEKLKKRIERLERQSTMVSDVVQKGYKRHLVIFGYDISRENKLRELNDILIQREAMIIIQQTEIEKYINTIERSDLRQIFVHRYIDNMDWYQVAQAMGYNNEDTPRKRHDRFLEKKL